MIVISSRVMRPVVRAVKSGDTDTLNNERIE